MSAGSKLAVHSKEPGEDEEVFHLRGRDAFDGVVTHMRDTFASDAKLLNCTALRTMAGYGFLMSTSVQQEFRTWLQAASGHGDVLQQAIASSDEDVLVLKLDCVGACQFGTTGPVHGSAPEVDPHAAGGDGGEGGAGGPPVLKADAQTSSPAKHSRVGTPNKRLRSKSPGASPTHSPDQPKAHRQKIGDVAATMGTSVSSGAR